MIKASPSDFVVQEIMDFQPCGQGEHFWLDITKKGLSTERVARTLAKFSGVAYKDVGYSGMKDVQAVTRQWFSVWMPKQLAFDWTGFDMPDVTINSVNKHARKIKRATHSGNRFKILIRDFSGDSSLLEQRLEAIEAHGVPNYFGAQRFGRDASNLSGAADWFAGKVKLKDKYMRGIVLSSARAFMFNLVVSGRVSEGSWCQLKPNEPAALEGSNSIFVSNDEGANQQRLMSLDIHPTAPMWGSGSSQKTADYSDLASWEYDLLSDHKVFLEGLEEKGLEYQRRALRSVPKHVNISTQDDNISVSFELQKGQFATSVIRELVATN